ncbi:hypothetical protein FQR65_LT04245 [Abscondita terminalis]|nr:hypothetical protein FQR65_LT04245 [Abscondita terminalis]
MNPENTKVLEFLKVVLNLKHSVRKGWEYKGVENAESIASHMYNMALMTFLLDDNSTLDRLQCLQLAIVHDLAECIVGDITPQDNIPEDVKHKLEDEAMYNLTKDLGEVGKRIYELYDQYQKKETEEAKFVKDLDRFDLILTASEYEARDELLSYCMYLPTLYLGPFIKFEHIKSSYTVQSKDVGKRSFQLFIQFLRFGFWLLFVEFCLHYFYISAMFYNLDMVHSLNSVALYGYGYCMGQFFHLKYVVFYGLSTSIAAFENIKSPSTPKCIGRIHLYSDMWKYFDVGLYNFLVNYIYFPTVGNFGTFRKLLSSMLCFCYVYIWHGSENYILIWSFYNYLGIIIEQLIKALSTSKYAKKMQDHWRQRLLCAIYSPLLAASAISNFYFFAGTDIGNVFVKRLFQSNARSNLMLLFSLYCCCHVSTHVKKWESKPHKD